MARRRTQLSLAEGAGTIEDAALADEARRRYLNYALSVITARALPDVRDGLKPVQRRILYAMHHELRLRSDSKHRKCALIVGDVMGKFHPHGDSAIYEALARMAQNFVMRLPLVDGRGNFGSPDGDAPAAMRYTEARLARASAELLSELGKKTVHFRPNYDATRFEPAVLPARFPNLLINGSQGIAVGMATSIPPHHPAEVLSACIHLVEQPKAELPDILRIIKGPDFPTGGQLMASKGDLREVYERGQGSLKLRGEWKTESAGRGAETVVLTSIPYGVERRAIVSQVADVIVQRKLPVLLDVRDESTDICRVVLEIKKGADPQLVMAYLYRHTSLQTNVQVNLTCLVPTGHPDVAAPERLGLLEVLHQFLRFRMEVVTKRLTHDLDELKKRIHVLEALATVFDALDETLKIIRRSEGRQDAAAKLIKRFEFTEVQVDAILDLRLYRLAKLEILVIQKELKEKRTEARKLERLLKSDSQRWSLVREELAQLQEAFSERRRTKVVQSSGDPEYSAEDFIVHEDATVILTQQGWVKRQREVKDVAATRVREGDQVLNLAVGSTKAALAFFSSAGVCYVCRVADVPASTGHGTPIQKIFRLADGERILHMLSLDHRVLEVPEGSGTEPEPPFVWTASRSGMTLRFSLRSHREPSTRNGRRFMRLREGDEVVAVELVDESDHIGCITRKGHALVCQASDVSLLSGAGKGVTLVKLGAGDAVVAAEVLSKSTDKITIRLDSGRELAVTSRNQSVVARGGKGHALFKRGKFAEVVKAPPEPLEPLGSN